ncbi:MAG: 2-oxoacid:acceptor oxidoreductase subunit alpha [bacterium]|jgi:2-oxoglutarate ferredoxin oxidoreductase subunit alpha
MTKRQILQGNEAVALGAIKAGLNFFAGYPITPASEILHKIVEFPQVKVIQMEDEIASINACVGAALAGAKTMTTTSGPGFSLMQEGIGLAHMVQAPLVVVNVQRVGPATGMPTFGAQGDIFQCRYGSHGDYFPIVFYPNSVSELYRYTIEAMNAAEESLSPVILLSDGLIGHLYETAELNDVPIRHRKVKPLGHGRRHFTALTHSGDYPRATAPSAHQELIASRAAKTAEAAKRYEFYEYLRVKGSDTLLIAFGAASRAAYHFKQRFSIFRPIRIFPMLDALKKIAASYERIVVMEMNAGQYKLLVEAMLHRPVGFVPLLGGAIKLSYLEERIRKCLPESI